MQVSVSYLGRSQFRQKSGGERIIELAPNLLRDQVGFDARLADPLRFREAISALHDVVINDLRFKPRDKTAYEAWKAAQGNRESALRNQARHEAIELVAAGKMPTSEHKQRHASALKTYWNARAKMNTQLRAQDPILWRRLMPFDPIITVADDVVLFECFSADESSYGCLSVDRDSSFSGQQNVTMGTTNIDYSWDLYHSFQNLRTYRETRFNINPDCFAVSTSQREDYHEEKIDLPNGWLRGFLQLQAAMMLPMTRVSLSVDAVYSLLAWLRRHREKSGPRAIRFELNDGQPPRLVLEPWGTTIESHGPAFCGAVRDPIRIWGRRRLLALARLLPLATSVDVCLLGTGLPSFWIVQMGSMRLTLGLSGWTSNDWTRGSAVEMLLSPAAAGLNLVASAAGPLSQKRRLSVSDLSSSLNVTPDKAAAAMNQLALRGQAVFDLYSQVLRWRQILPMELSDREIGPPHPEMFAAQQLASLGKIRIETQQSAPRGGYVLSGKVENQSCEVLVDSDGMVRSGKCRCAWHFKTGIRNGPCRHLQALRLQFLRTHADSR
jgi:hypothetical protein